MADLPILFVPLLLFRLRLRRLRLSASASVLQIDLQRRL